TVYNLNTQTVGPFQVSIASGTSRESISEEPSAFIGSNAVRRPRQTTIVRVARDFVRGRSRAATPGRHASLEHDGFYLLAILHNEHNVLQDGDVRQRITFDRDQISEFAALNRANRILPTHEIGRLHGRGANRVQGSQPEP